MTQTSAVVYNTFHDLDQFVALSQAKCLLPQSRALIADNKDIRVVLFLIDKLSQFFQRQFAQREIDVRLLSG